MSKKRIRFPIVVKRGSSVVKVYRDRKPTGTYYRVAYHIGGKRHRLHFNDLEKATSEAEAKAAQLSRGDMDAAQLTGKDRLVYGRAVEAVKEMARRSTPLHSNTAKPEGSSKAARSLRPPAFIHGITGVESRENRSRTLWMR